MYLAICACDVTGGSRAGVGQQCIGIGVSFGGWVQSTSNHAGMDEQRRDGAWAGLDGVVAKHGRHRHLAGGGHGFFFACSSLSTPHNLVERC